MDGSVMGEVPLYWTIARSYHHPCMAQRTKEFLAVLKYIRRIEAAHQGAMMLIK